MSEILVEREMARDTICQHISYIPFNQLPVGGMCISEDDYDSSDDTVVEEQQKTFLEVKESTMASNKTTTDKIRIEDRLNNLSVEYLDCEPASQAQEQLRNLLEMKMRKTGIPRTEEVLAIQENYNKLRYEKIKEFPTRFNSETLAGRIRVQQERLLTSNRAACQKLKTKIEGLQWCLDNVEQQIEAEIYLECPTAVLAVKLEGEGKDGLVALATGSERILVVSVTSSYLRSFFTSLAYKDPKYRNAYAWVNKYHRRETFAATTFSQLRFITPDFGEAKDEKGNLAVVTASWLRDKSTVPPLFYRQLMDQYNKDKREGVDPKFLPCPEGRSSRSTTTSPKNATVIPSLSFLNKQEEHNCMPKSIAWALHSIGKEDVAVNFLETLREAETKSNTPLLVHRVRAALATLSIEFRQLSGRRGRRRRGRNSMKGSSMDTPS